MKSRPHFPDAQHLLRISIFKNLERPKGFQGEGSMDGIAGPYGIV